MYTLIIIAVMEFSFMFKTPGAVAITHVDGFNGAEKCAAAAAQVQASKLPDKVQAICVKTKETW